MFFDRVTDTQKYHMYDESQRERSGDISNVRHVRHKSGERGRGLKSQLCEAEAREEPLLQLDPHWHVGEGLRVSETGGRFGM